VQNENNRVPPPWGDDMEEALIAQAEAIRKQTTSVPCRRCRGFDLLLCVSWSKLGLIAILLLWFLLAFAMGHSHATGHMVIRNEMEQSARSRYYAAAGKVH
jgi:hypothetical protein